MGADGAVCEVAGEIEREDAVVAKWNFENLPRRALVEAVGTGITIVRLLWARRPRSLRASHGSLASTQGGAFIGSADQPSSRSRIHSGSRRQSTTAQTTTSLQSKV